ncbi:hypothetical protein B0H11DRAFT_1918345 [Mycena galericulata]|nr:hypothetical protein B0H11DRAFT_1918345 [Mycena galericulata]
MYNRLEHTMYWSVTKRSAGRERVAMLNMRQNPQISMDPLQLLAIYEKILLVQSSETRVRWLDILGDIFLPSYKISGTIDGLNQAVCTMMQYQPVRGDSLLRHFERLGDVTDLNQSVLRFKATVWLTPDGHPRTQ